VPPETAVGTDAALRVELHEAGYGPITILRDVRIAVPRGAITAIVGANGAGKTTLLRTISGLQRADGEVRLGDRDLLRLAPHLIARAGVGHVAEGRRLFVSQSVRSNLDLGLLAGGRGDRDVRIEEVLELFPILRERLAQPAGALSGGQLQMLAIAQALVARPEVLLVDEPSIGLAPVVVDEVFAALQRLRGTGTTIVLVEQLVERALALADRAYVLRSGRVTAEGTGAELLASPRLSEAYGVAVGAAAHAR
jgi:branched-chain amino acid transport system ATP-binding protein